MELRAELNAQRTAIKFPEINTLRSALTDLDPGQSGLISFADKPVMTRAFFPGGNGLYLGENAEHFPARGILVLGSNFGALQNFIDDRQQLVSQDETGNPGTWLGLKKRMAENSTQYFLHRRLAFPARRRRNNPADKGRWLRDNALMRSCRGFFDLTMTLVRPRVVVAIGNASAAFLGIHYGGNIVCWESCKFKGGIDGQPFAERTVDQETVTFVAITHPSMSNAHNRSSPFNTAESERELLQSILKNVDSHPLPAYLEGCLHSRADTVETTPMQTSA